MMQLSSATKRHYHLHRESSYTTRSRGHHLSKSKLTQKWRRIGLPPFESVRRKRLFLDQKSCF